MLMSMCDAMEPGWGIETKYQHLNLGIRAGVGGGTCSQTPHPMPNAELRVCGPDGSGPGSESTNAEPKHARGQCSAEKKGKEARRRRSQHRMKRPKRSPSATRNRRRRRLARGPEHKSCHKRVPPTFGAKVGRIGPSSVNSGQIRPKFVELGPNLAKLGPRLTKLAPSSPNLAEPGPKLPEIWPPREPGGRIWAE